MLPGNGLQDEWRMAIAVIEGGKAWYGISNLSSYLDPECGWY